MLLNQSFELKAATLHYNCVRIKQKDISTFENDFVEAAKQAPRLFKNGAFVIEFVHDELISAIKIKRIRKCIESVGANLIGLKSDKEEQIAESQKAHIAIIRDNKAGISSANKKPKSSGVREVMVQNRVRSGTQIYAKDKDLVICGDVSHGAEVIASGNIIIYGALNGKAIAGADGDNNAQIFCSAFSPELLSIGGIYIVNEDIDPEHMGRHVRARMIDGRITLANFNQTPSPVTF